MPGLAIQLHISITGCRYGHNELDDPTITLPLSYQAVAHHPPVLQLYTDKLDKLGLLNSSEVHTWQVSAHYMTISNLCQMLTLLSQRSHK